MEEKKEQKFKMAIVVTYEGPVLGYCPDSAYPSNGGKVSVEDYGEGTVVMVDSYHTWEAVAKHAEKTGLSLVRILTIIEVKKVDWEGVDEKNV